MIYIYALPLIFISIVLILVGKFTKFKLLENISKIVLIVSIVFFIIEYLVETGWNFEKILRFLKNLF